MALLNPPDVVPEAMRFVLRAVLAFPGATCAHEEVVALVAPQGLVEAMASIGTPVDVSDEPVDDPKTGGSKIADASLQALRRLGLVRVEGGQVSATEAVIAEYRSIRDVSPNSFARAVRTAIWRVADGDNGPEGVSDLVGALALHAAAPEPLRPFDGFDEPTAHRRFDEYQIDRRGPRQQDWAVPNREQWLTYRRLVPYLGVGVPVGVRAGQRVIARGLLADCSTALAEELREFEPGTVPVNEFVEACAKALPYLDGGPFAVEHLDDSAAVSGGLSLSLRQLEISGLLELRRESDTGTRVVALGPEPGARADISHVRWIGSKPRRSRS